MQPRDDGPRVNEKIDAASVLVIDGEGEKRGEMSVAAAMELADEAGLDL